MTARIDRKACPVRELLGSQRLRELCEHLLASLALQEPLIGLVQICVVHLSIIFPPFSSITCESILVATLIGTVITMQVYKYPRLTLASFVSAVPVLAQ